MVSLSNHHVVSPTYGRDYKDNNDAKRDWDSGKDFVYNNLGGGGKYCSKRDFGPEDIIEIRFNKLQDCVIV